MPTADQMIGAMAWALYNLPDALASVGGDLVRQPDELEWHVHPQRFLEADGDVLIRAEDQHIQGYALITIVAIDRDGGCAAVSHGGMNPYVVQDIDEFFEALLQLGTLPGYLDPKPWGLSTLLRRA